MTSTSTATGGAPILSIGAGTSSVGVGVGGSIVSVGLGGSSLGLGVGGLGRVAPAAATSTTATLDITGASSALAAEPALVAPKNVEPTPSNSQAAETTDPEPAATPTKSGAVATALVAAAPDDPAVSADTHAVSGVSAPTTMNSAATPLNNAAAADNSAGTPGVSVAVPASNPDTPESDVAASGESTASSISSIASPENNAANPENSIVSPTATSTNNIVSFVDTNTGPSTTPLSFFSQVNSGTIPTISAATPDDSALASDSGAVTPAMSPAAATNRVSASDDSLAQSINTGGAVPTASTITISLPLSLSPSASINTVLQNPTNGIKTIWTIITTTVSPTVSDQPVNGGESTIFPSSSGASIDAGSPGTNEPVDGGQSTNISPNSGTSAGVSDGGSLSLVIEGSVIGGDNTITPSGSRASPSIGNIGTPLSISNPSTTSSTALSAPSSFSNGTVTTRGITSASVSGNSSLSVDSTGGGLSTMTSLTLVENGDTITLTAVAATSGSSPSTSGPTDSTTLLSSDISSISLSSSPVLTPRAMVGNNTFTLRGRGFFG
ncbi:hypothetical protein MMC17_009123 [Xylographa soralifera]|nr:hypothetical protein [Xylographa soralifera]